MSPYAGGGGLRGLRMSISCAHGAQINFGDLTYGGRYLEIWQEFGGVDCAGTLFEKAK
jgi:hypothetical protein